MSAEQPRLALADLTKSYLSRSLGPRGGRGLTACPLAMAMEFFRPSSVDGHGRRPDASSRQGRSGGVRRALHAVQHLATIRRCRSAEK